MNELLSVYHPAVPPVLAALADTPAMDRLCRVGMNCGCEYTAFPRFSRGRAYNRFLHSLGVGLIVWHFTEDPAQAAAGLLHDVATPVFAHVVDFLRGDHLKQEATEAGTRERIAGSPEITAALARFGLRVDDAADYHRYPVADNDSPRLSADRLEYTLGNARNYGFLTLDEIAALYADLCVGQGEDGAPELCFRSREQGLIFARTALACSRVYVSAEDRYAMQRLSELLAEAIRAGVLTEEDLSADEPAVISRLERSALAPAWSAFRALRVIHSVPAKKAAASGGPEAFPLGGRWPEGPDEGRFVPDVGSAGADAHIGPPSASPPDDRPWRRVPAKKRRIDPLIAGQGRASALDPAFAADLAAFLAEPQTDWILAEA